MAVEQIELYCSYCVQDKDAGFALRRDEQAKQSLVTLAVMIQVHVANTPWEENIDLEGVISNISWAVSHDITNTRCVTLNSYTDSAKNINPNLA